MEWTLITRWTAWNERTISTKDHTFSTNAEELLVLWKGALHWRTIHEVGDGMEVLVWYDRETIWLEIDPHFVEQWMWLYKEFDEDKNETISYLYGFGNDEESVEIVNEILEDFDVKNTVIAEGKFTKFEHTVHDLWLLESTDHASSFLLWLLLVYGSFIWDDEVLFHASINLPMVWSITQHEETYWKAVSLLEDAWIYIRSEYTMHRSSQVWSVWIYDRELLTLMKYALWDERPVAKQNSAEQLLEACNEKAWTSYTFIKTFAI